MIPDPSEKELGPAVGGAANKGGDCGLYMYLLQPFCTLAPLTNTTLHAFTAPGKLRQLNEDITGL